MSDCYNADFEQLPAMSSAISNFNIKDIHNWSKAFIGELSEMYSTRITWLSEYLENALEYIEGDGILEAIKGDPKLQELVPKRYKELFDSYIISEKEKTINILMQDLASAKTERLIIEGELQRALIKLANLGKTENLRNRSIAVSYTHLTLPTICSV
eukprot:TRINITY_DN7821_c0_g9_i1.p1 TRINITY_DN7821_c0_g9~~TRINITY_DN7821_c0_g9_i1.p1  ORF type:complete len:157 (+),score=23.92 TRINITY_DN7821_c0_g9_i1:168-638(+)